MCAVCFVCTSFRFTVESAGKKSRVFFFPLQHLIHIHDPTSMYADIESEAVGEHEHELLPVEE